MANARLELNLRLTTTDGLVKEMKGDFDFGDDDEMAADQYWANLKGSAMGSETEERGKRGQGQDKSKGQNPGQGKKR